MNFKKYFSFVFIIFALGFLVWNIFGNWQSVTSFRWSFNIVDFVLFCVFLLPIFLVNAFSWHLVMQLLGEDIRYLINLKVWVISNCGRFIPGVVWQYAGRVHLSNQLGVSKSKATTAVLIEAAVTVCIGISISLLTIKLYEFPLKLQIDNLLLLLVPVFVVFLSLFILLTKKYLNKILQTIKGLIRVREINFTLLRVFLLVVSISFQFILGGSTLFFLVRSVTGLALSLYPVFIGIYAISWLLGYFAFFAPSGFGVQEISIAGLLSLYIPFPLASLLAILFRFAMLLSEFLTLSLALLFSRKRF